MWVKKREKMKHVVGNSEHNQKVKTKRKKDVVRQNRVVAREFYGSV